VSSQGPVISAEHRARLFQPFVRGPNVGDAKGLGLGLYIASEIAKAHGGTLDVVSAERETRFTFRIPAGRP
jgi:signal transduction histidine kinase